MINKEKPLEESEIDVSKLLYTIWSKKSHIIKISSVFAIIGLLIAFTSKIEYKATCKLLPESLNGNESDLGGLSGLAGLAGFDLNSLDGNSLLSPDLYPQIVRSEPFLDKLINSPVYFERLDTTISTFDFFKEFDRLSLMGTISEYSIGLPGKIRKLIANDGRSNLNSYGMRRYTKDDWKIVEDFSKRLNVAVETSTGIISLDVEIPDPVASAQIAELMVSRLTDYVVKYKSEKAIDNLSFIEERFNEAKLEYEDKQKQLAQFTHRNRNVTNSIIQLEYQRLQNEMNISFEVYKGLATQFEHAKIEVKEDTPVFTIVEPVRIPEDKSKPQRGLIIFLFISMGVVLATITVLYRSSINGN